MKTQSHSVRCATRRHSALVTTAVCLGWFLAMVHPLTAGTFTWDGYDPDDSFGGGSAWFPSYAPTTFGAVHSPAAVVRAKPVQSSVPASQSAFAARTTNALPPTPSTSSQTPLAYGDLLPFGAATGDNTLARGDDNSSGAISLLGFGPDGSSYTLPFFSGNYTSLYVNNNGNVTFNAAFSTYQSVAFPSSTHTPIIAPLWSDVSTLGGSVQDPGISRACR